MSKDSIHIVVDQISEDFRAGDQQSLGCSVHYSDQEAAALFLTVDDVSLPLQEHVFRAKLRQLAAALLEEAELPQAVSLRLPAQD